MKLARRNPDDLKMEDELAGEKFSKNVRYNQVKIQTRNTKT